jgi:predicted RNA-binding Zn-ribbon protein involved in translation (DUF1610 family)
MLTLHSTTQTDCPNCSNADITQCNTNWLPQLQQCWHYKVQHQQTAPTVAMLTLHSATPTDCPNCGTTDITKYNTNCSNADITQCNTNWLPQLWQCWHYTVQHKLPQMWHCWYYTVPHRLSQLYVRMCAPMSVMHVCVSPISFGMKLRHGRLLYFGFLQAAIITWLVRALGRQKRHFTSGWWNDV